MDVLKGYLKRGDTPNFIRVASTCDETSLRQLNFNYASCCRLHEVKAILEKWPFLLDSVNEYVFNAQNIPCFNWDTACYLWEAALAKNPQLCFRDNATIWFTNSDHMERVAYLAKQPGAKCDLPAYWNAQKWFYIQELCTYFPKAEVYRQVVRRYFNDRQGADHLEEILDVIPFDYEWIKSAEDLKFLRGALSINRCESILQTSVGQRLRLRFELPKMSLDEIWSNFSRDEEYVIERLLEHSQFAQLVDCFKRKHNSQDLEPLTPLEHYSVLKHQWTELARLCNQWGFKVFRSIVRVMDYGTACGFFAECKKRDVAIIEDDGGFWIQQKAVWRKDIFTHDPRRVRGWTPLQKEASYRVVVYGSETEYRDEQGYTHPEIVYDIVNARVESQELDEYAYHPGSIIYSMTGINNGPFWSTNKPRYEPEWTTDRNTFRLWSGNREFGTGRDGGCLNCGGLYFVKVLLE